MGQPITFTLIRSPFEHVPQCVPCLSPLDLRGAHRWCCKIANAALRRVPYRWGCTHMETTLVGSSIKAA